MTAKRVLHLWYCWTHFDSAATKDDECWAKLQRNALQWENEQPCEITAVTLKED